MNQITELAETIESKQISDLQKTTENYEILTIRNDGNKFNMTVVNTGDLPVHLTRLWVENTTDSSWPIAKYELDIAIPTGGSVKDIGQSLALTASDTQSYMMLLVTDRGNTEKVFVNSVGDQASSIFLNLRATPTVIPTTFETSVILEVINTGTNQLINLTPIMISAVETCTVGCIGETLVSPLPASFDSLDPGDIATFEWVYSIDADSGDFVTFTAGLVNGLGSDTAVVTVQPVPVAENADVALESGGVADDAAIDDSILLFHMEQVLVPTPGYQMMSSDIDGGANGLKLDMETFLTANPVSLFTNNGSQLIQIPAGNWNTVFAMRSEPLPNNISTGTGIGLIFHMEDGDNVNPDNSEGDASRDLEECGVSQFQERISRTNDDAEQKGSTTNRGPGGSTDFELAYDGTFQHIGVRWSLDVAQGAQINSADIRWRADESDSGSPPDLIIGAQDVDNAPEFKNNNNDISNRWASVTSATVTWSPADWTTGEEGADTTTPDLSAIVQEIVDRPGWVSGNNIVFIFKDNSAGSNTGKRVAEHYDAGGPGQAARLTVDYGTTGNPDWQAGTGPHNSGAYYYDGISMCHRSTNNVADNDQNRPHTFDQTTSFWFRTPDEPYAVTSEEAFIFSDENNGYPNADFQKISIGSQGDGRILYSSNGNGGTPELVDCLTVNSYDTGIWYMVTAVRDYEDEHCWLYVHNLDGTLAETVINVDYNYPGKEHYHTNGKLDIGSINESGNYFNGYLDDIMHWNRDMLDASEIASLAITNYGTQAHQIDVELEITDQSGTTVTPVYFETEILIPFQDSKGGSDTTDSAYTLFNTTMNIISITNITAGQRLNYSFNFVPAPDSTWEPLELDIKFDDSGFTSPYPSYMQIPYPNNPFQSYVTYSMADDFTFFLDNSGNDGLYFVYPGTRVTFNGTNGSFASFIKTINGTGTNFDVNETEDSLYIPSGQVAKLFFYKEPTDRPCKANGSNCSGSTIIPPGAYRVAVWINGYSDQGESFGRSITIGVIQVTT